MNDIKKLLKNTRVHLMTGVSHMIPFVVAGGILLALAMLFSGSGASVPTEGIWADIANMGIMGLGLMVPVLSAYIAYSMADRPGLAPGFIGGMVSNAIGAGFLGGIISGILAGIIVYKMKNLNVNDSLKSIMPILIIPLLSTFLVGGIMYWVIGSPIAALMSALNSWLELMGTGNLALLGLVLGSMIGFDLGGPVNKVAFGFGSAMVGTMDPITGLPTETSLAIMAGIGVAICVPPIAMGIATLIAPKKFTASEKDSGKASIIMGLFGISEGAVPFAAADPVRVIPANMFGSAIGASIAMYFGAGNPVPWGGWVVAPIAQKPLVYIIASLIGAGITAGVYVLVKKPVSAEISEGATSEKVVDDFDFEIEQF